MPNNQLKGKSEADTITSTLSDRRETAPHAKIKQLGGQHRILAYEFDSDVARFSRWPWAVLC
jgi:hypothetical protein